MTQAGTHDPCRVRAKVRGAVQGVGFRPFVFRLAVDFHLSGFVANTPEGVTLEVEGASGRIDSFFGALELQAPEHARIESVERTDCIPTGERGFKIRQSHDKGDRVAYVLPDIATCEACVEEIFDSKARRYRYPFTNCTHCGPRYSIVESIPYDRPNTSMKHFSLCDACRAEYENPDDRRFHAQPIACPECGPNLALWDAQGTVLQEGDRALQECADRLDTGVIVAVKGLGGFHLMVRADNAEGVMRLRTRKQRDEKPFALMYPDVERVGRDCNLDSLHQDLLHSSAAPIVLLSRRDDCAGWADAIAPGNPFLGVMLPYTPLHHLLLKAVDAPVVATSGNLSEEPICIDEREALERLGGVADCFLVHDRSIVRAVDDSVLRVVRGRELLLRRSRGYVPLPVSVGESGPSVLATGAHLKNTVAVSKGANVFLSQHIGDLETQAAFDAFVRACQDMQRLFVAPREHVVRDTHPDYLSTQHAQRIDSEGPAVQHHFAHVLACMAENRLEGPVLGIAWDGAGHGDDGILWGGEFLVATRDGYRRVAHLRPFRLPGGEKAMREPRRAAFGMLAEIFQDDGAELAGLPTLSAFSVSEASILAVAAAKGVNTPITTSVGRLFDAVASITGIRQVLRYEGQAAMELEHAAWRWKDADRGYGMRLLTGQSPWILDWEQCVRSIIEDVNLDVEVEAVAHGFHSALAQGACAVAAAAGMEDVVLTGGCFQNALLTDLVAQRIESIGCRVHTHRLVPPNDGGVALGQALYGLRWARNKRKDA